MNNENASAVKLLKTNRYNTYQLFAYMANQATKPGDGLKIAALSCLSWLRRRLEGNKIPQELMMMEADQYDAVKEKDLRSFSISDDYLIDVVSDPEEGFWTLRIIENDLGALNNGEIVPGRTIESNLAFRIFDNKLECAFKTSISDKENVPKADCIRFSLVKELCLNPLFGLKQVDKIYYPDKMEINDEDRLNEIVSIYHNSDNELPLIIYSYDDYSGEFRQMMGLGVDPRAGMKQLQEASVKKNVLSKADAYAARYAGIARPYFLPKKMNDKFREAFAIGNFKTGSVLLIDPPKFGGKIKIYPYEDKDTYRLEANNFSRDKDINFHDTVFVEEARILLEQKNEDYKSEILLQLDETTRNLEMIRSKISRSERMADYQKNSKDDSRQELQETLEKLQKSDNIILVLNKEIERLKSRMAKMEDYIAYMKRKAGRPTKHSEITEWASDFEYVIFDRQAEDCLARKDAENVEVSVICDALDYLEYLYSKYLFEGMDKDELNNKSAAIYNRPYEVSPSGITIAAKGECKIRYTDVEGERKEYPLDWHLKCGNHGELIRIYFIIDKARKKIVIGSLPNHLTY